jgi:hypothetical protein
LWCFCVLDCLPWDCDSAVCRWERWAVGARRCMCWLPSDCTDVSHMSCYQVTPTLFFVTSSTINSTLTPGHILLHGTNPSRFCIGSVLLYPYTRNYSGNKIKVKINNQLSEEYTINDGVRQGCTLSPTLFNIYMNEITVKWSHIYTKGITLSTTKKILSFLQTIWSQYLIQRIIYREEYLHCKHSNNCEWKYHKKNLRRLHFRTRSSQM